MTDTLILRFSSAEDCWQNWASAAIRRLGHSEFSHVDLVLPDGSCLGASDQGAGSPCLYGEPRGVAIRPPNYQRFSIRRDMILATDNADKIIEKMKSQLGKPFDSSGLWEFLGDKPVDTRDWRDPAHWWCSELKAWSLDHDLFFRFPLTTPKNRVSPSDLRNILDQDDRWINRDTFHDPIAGLVLDPGER